MKTLITGDIHGDFPELNKLIERQKPDLVICCGDFGYWPKFNDIKKEVKPQGSKILWCEGNHEDHWAIRDRESDEVAPNIIYMPRGSVYTLPNGKTILFMGGAYSIDKDRRILGRDWFPEETITQKDLMNLPEIDIDIFITHTCPNELVSKLMLLYPDKGYEPSNEALSELWKIYKPKYWFFGHWHQYNDGILNDVTEWYCLSYPNQGQRWWLVLETIL